MVSEGIELSVRLDRNLQEEALVANIYDAVYTFGFLVAGKARHMMCHPCSNSSPQAFTEYMHVEVSQANATKPPTQRWYNQAIRS